MNYEDAIKDIRDALSEMDSRLSYLEGKMNIAQLVSKDTKFFIKSYAVQIKELGSSIEKLLTERQSI